MNKQLENKNAIKQHIRKNKSTIKSNALKIEAAIKAKDKKKH